jgi:hypothetical protein
MKHVKSLLAVATIVIMGLVGCSKGSTGPAGAAGPAGPAGPGNVMYSDWITLNFTYNANDSAFEDTLLAPAITSGILDSGVILSYVQFTDANNTVHIQPIASLGSFFFEDFSPGHINLSSPFIDLTGYLYRYVIIPGTKKTNGATIAKVKGYTPTELKAMSYDQVQQVLADKN